MLRFLPLLLNLIFFMICTYFLLFHDLQLVNNIILGDSISWFGTIKLAALKVFECLWQIFNSFSYILLIATFVGIFSQVRYDFVFLSMCLLKISNSNIFDQNFGVFGPFLSYFCTIFGLFFALFACNFRLKHLKTAYHFIIHLCAKLFKIDEQFVEIKKKIVAKKAAVKIENDHKKPADNILPSLFLLQEPQAHKAAVWNYEARQKQLEQILQEFGVRGKIVKSSVGPIVTLYELQPEPGVKAIRIIGLSNDIARNMSALSVRIAPIPGRDVLGIEVSNPKREVVYLKSILDSDEYQKASGLVLAMGCDISGKPVISNLAQMPHMLMAGTTGSGKSVVIHTLLLSILFKHTPQTCRLIMIDPKMLELSSYADIPHLLMPVIIDSRLAVVALKWAVQEMDRRYKLMSAAGVRNLDAYNAKTQDLLPYIVVVVDEFADLMLVAGKEIDVAIQRLVQMARAAGIHLILATQRPSVDVITGTIKANFPTRVALHVASKIDGRTVLGDYGGAEQLLGKGDMLFLTGGKLLRVHGPFVSTEEVEGVVEYWKSVAEPNYQELDLGVFDDDEMDEGDSNELDKIYAFLQRTGRVSTSSVQREFNIGFNRAAKFLEMLEKRGKVSTPDNMGRRKLV